LTFKEVGDRSHGVKLELLVGVELQLHSPSSLRFFSSMRLISFSKSLSNF
jgi:hypothetical protein